MEETFTIQYLINKLQAIEDKTQPVHLEGCDCYGSWSGEIEEIKEGGFKGILLERI